MIFGFTPVAEASIVTLMKSIDKVIINPIILFLFALALAYFLYGLAQYLINPDNEKIREKSKTQMISGIFGLFIMVAVFGIMRIILNTVGESKIKIQSNGDYQVNNYNLKTKNKSKGDSIQNANSSVTNGMIDLRGASNIDLTNVASPKVTDFTTSPFRVKYISNQLCAREELNVSAPTEYESTTGVQQKANSDGKILGVKPLIFGFLTAYDPNAQLYYSWIDARYPIHGGTDNDCVLAVDITAMANLKLSDLLPGSPNSPDFSSPSDMSKGPSPFTVSYDSNDLFYRVQASGVSPLLNIARNIAIKNAYLLLGIKLKGVNNMTIVYPTAQILEEKYTKDSQGNYNYWVAVQTSKKNGDATQIIINPFKVDYKTDSMFYKTIDYSSAKDLSIAKNLAINNAILKLSNEIPNGTSNVKFVTLLDQKQVFNKKTGEYDYWVAVAALKATLESVPVSESSNISPLTNIYKTNNLYYKVVDSGVSKDLNTAKNIAMSNAILKLSKNTDLSSGTNLVSILEEKYTKDSQGNYNYWVAVQTTRPSKSGSSIPAS